MRNYFDDPEEPEDRDADTFESLDVGARESRTARRARDLLSDAGGTAGLVYFGED